MLKLKIFKDSPRVAGTSPHANETAEELAWQFVHKYLLTVYDCNSPIYHSRRFRRN